VRLAVILSNPPLTSGTRTLNRVDLARRVLSCDAVSIANIFPLATHRTGAVAAVGIERDTWLGARASISASLDGASKVLLAYGVQEPSGMARLHFREQVLWLSEEIQGRGLTAVQFGNRPLHPSRWQRFTHRTYPELDFPKAVHKVLVGVNKGGQLG